MLADVMIVGRFLDQDIVNDRRVDRLCRGVGQTEERLAIDLAHENAILELDPWVRPDHLEIENHPSRPDRFDHPVQDVHDVLGFHSSERPGEHDQVEGGRLDLDLRRRRGLICDSVCELGREPGTCSVDGLSVRIERNDMSRLCRDSEGQPAVSATDLEHTRS
jgi:hypothetical protein